MSNILLLIGIILFPLLILLLCNKINIFYKMGPVLLVYLFGVIIGNVGILSEENRKMIGYLAMGSLPLALPLLLFSSDLKRWIRLAPAAFVSMIIGLFSVLIVILLGYKLFAKHIPEAWKVSGMLVGVYSGGTPNLGAIKTALKVDDELYIITHTYDMLVSSVYLLFVLTIGKTVFSFILPSFKFQNNNEEQNEIDFHGKELFWGLHKKKYTKGLLLAFVIALVIVAISSFLGFKINEKYQMAVIILLITSLGLLGSINRKIRKIDRSFELGMYFILIFCLAVSSLADIRELVILSPYLLLYVVLAVFGSLVLQVIISRFFKIDTDTVIITSTALICSPPFVPVVAGALGNKEVVLSGIAIGVLGFVIGNYLGIACAYLLQALM